MSITRAQCTEPLTRPAAYLFTVTSAIGAFQEVRRRRKRPQPRVKRSGERSGTLGTDMNRRPALKERQAFVYRLARSIPASAYPDDLTPSQALVQKKRLTSAALSER